MKSKKLPSSSWPRRHRLLICVIATIIVIGIIYAVYLIHWRHDAVASLEHRKASISLNRNRAFYTKYDDAGCKHERYILGGKTVCSYAITSYYNGEGSYPDGVYTLVGKLLREGWKSSNLESASLQALIPDASSGGPSWLYFYKPDKPEEGFTLSFYAKGSRPDDLTYKGNPDLRRPAIQKELQQDAYIYSITVEGNYLSLYTWVL